MINNILSVTELRLAKGWSMRKLASEAGCSLKAVWSLETHATKPSLLTLGKISKALGQDLETFKNMVEATAPGHNEDDPPKYRSVGQALDQLPNNGPEMVVVVPMTVQEMDSMQKRLTQSEKELENIKTQLGAAGLLTS